MNKFTFKVHLSFYSVFFYHKTLKPNLYQYVDSFHFTIEEIWPLFVFYLIL